MVRGYGKKKGHGKRPNYPHQFETRTRVNKHLAKDNNALEYSRKVIGE